MTEGTLITGAQLPTADLVAPIRTVEVMVHSAQLSLILDQTLYSDS